MNQQAFSVLRMTPRLKIFGRVPPLVGEVNG
jgi:hypothetical protein